MAQWTQDEAIAFESARECITDLMAICTAQLAAERAKAEPDPAKLAELQRERSALAQERSALTVRDQQRIEEVRRDYGARVRAYRQAQTQRAA